MRIASLHLLSFRNYQDRAFEPSPGLTVLVGPNAAGKTNVIEAAQLVATGRSFRKPRWEELVRWGDEAGQIVAVLQEGDAPTVVDMRFTAAGSRTFRVNGASKARVSDATGILPCVLFTPDDLGLVKGPAEARRSAADDLGEQLSKAYGAVRRDYIKAIRHRNVLLREWQASDADLEPWDIQLTSLGARLFVHRRRLLGRIAAHASVVYEEFSGGEKLGIEYHDHCGLGIVELGSEVSTDDVERAILVSLGKRRAEERARRVTLVGPHRDDVRFLVDGRDARVFASQGQQRTIALAWTLAQVAVVEEISRKKPLLLLDDVMSELDVDRRRALTGLVQRDVQTIVSTTNIEYFDHHVLEHAAVINVVGD